MCATHADDRRIGLRDAVIVTNMLSVVIDPETFGSGADAGPRKSAGFRQLLAAIASCNSAPAGDSRFRESAHSIRLSPTAGRIAGKANATRVNVRVGLAPQSRL